MGQMLLQERNENEMNAQKSWRIHVFVPWNKAPDRDAPAKDCCIVGTNKAQ